MCYAGLAVFSHAGVQLLGASSARAVLPHLDQLRICILIMHIRLGCLFTLGSNIRTGPLGQIHHCFLLWCSLEHYFHGPGGVQVCFPVFMLVAASASALNNISTPLPFS